MIRVFHYLELERKLLTSGGIGVATQNQRKAMTLAGITAVGKGEAHDVVHLCTVGPKSFAYAKLAKHKGTPLVMSTHTTAEDFKGSFAMSDTAAPSLRKYLKTFYSMADVLIAPTQYTADLIRSYGLTNRIEVVSNGIDMSLFTGLKQRREDYRKKYGLEGTVVYSVGHVFLKKGLETFVNVARTSDVPFVWFGRVYNGAHSAKTDDVLKSAPPNVRFTGWVEDAIACHAAGDVFLFPTHNENQGIVLLEAAACGRAAVVRDIPVFNGWKSCIRADDDQTFAKQVAALVKDASKRSRRGAAMKREVRAHSLESVGKKLAAIYESLV
ncbi:MAG: glycosyltransferase family 4 protein [Candidatus Aenigmatarchaeota archaeon]|nr:MAG: glycosyltransferase family 4 protein [Candidatus Aenigmarchaeota archaeon]